MDMVYCTTMNTLVASWGGRLRAHIGRLAERVSEWSVARERTDKATSLKTDEEFDAFIAALPASDLKLKPEVEARVMKGIEEVEQGKDLSPGFDTVEEFVAHLKSDEDSDS